MSHNVDQTNYNDFAKKIASSGNYNVSFGISTQGLYKPFTTNSDEVGYPHYETPIVSEDSQGTSLGLNPFGTSTIGEGVIFGSGNTLIDWNSSVPTKNFVRSMGNKTPMNLVGWGYDIMGFPCPNFNETWDASGVTYASGEVTTANSLSNFLGFDGSELPSNSGSDVSYYDYKAGPLDVRWDMHRKVWTAYNGGVYAARITNVHIQDEEYAAGSYYFSEQITYDAKIYDGVSHSLEVTEAVRVGPAPVLESYKVKPLSSGDFCFLVNYPNEGGVPQLSVYSVEPLGVEVCGSGSEDEAGPVAITSLPSTYESSGVNVVISNPPIASMIFVSGILIFASGDGVS